MADNGFCHYNLFDFDLIYKQERIAACTNVPFRTNTEIFRHNFDVACRFSDRLFETFDMRAFDFGLKRIFNNACFRKIHAIIGH